MMSNPEVLRLFSGNLSNYLKWLFLLVVFMMLLSILITINSSLTKSSVTGEVRACVDTETALRRISPHAVDWRRFLPDSGGCLPNFFLGNQSTGDKARYKSGVIGFQHLNKAGGVTVRKCIKSFPSVREILISDLQRPELEAHAAFGTVTIDNIDILHGDYVFGLCKTLRRNSPSAARSCSYFTLLRDPYERVISSYLFCKVYGIDRTCGPFVAKENSVEEWALKQGSYFFYQLLQKPEYCRMGDRAKNEFSGVLADNLPTSDRSGRTRFPNQCWFLEKTILDNSLTANDREALLDFLIANLKNIFSVIGLSDKMTETFALLHEVYHLPFQDCFTRARNAGPKSNNVSLYSVLKKRLIRNSTVVDSLKEDVALYNEGLRIFELQMKAMNLSKH